MTGRSTSRPPTEPERRARRLAELVTELTGCEPTGALHAVREHQHEDRPDALDLVARAMIDVDAARPDALRVPPLVEREDGTTILDLSTPLVDDAATVRPVTGPTLELTPDEARFGRRLAHARTRVGDPRPPG